MKNFFFCIRRHHKTWFELITVQAKDSHDAVKKLPSCVSWNFISVGQCEVCDNDFIYKNSDATNPVKFCSHNCEQEREDRIRAFNEDKELLIDHDMSMNY